MDTAIVLVGAIITVISASAWWSLRGRKRRRGTSERSLRRARDGRRGHLWTRYDGADSGWALGGTTFWGLGSSDHSDSGSSDFGGGCGGGCGGGGGD